MKHPARLTLLMLSAVLLVAGCRNDRPSHEDSSVTHATLQGAWRATISFKSGQLAAMKDLEFLYSYNEGGTMTESSNYDEAANSTPPAYGIWKRVDARTFQTKYIYYTTKEPGPGDGAAKGDWWPAGHGVLTETITLTDDGQSYASVIKLVVYDKAGAQVAGGGDGRGAGRRVVF